MWNYWILITSSPKFPLKSKKWDISSNMENDFFVTARIWKTANWNWKGEYCDVDVKAIQVGTYWISFLENKLFFLRLLHETKLKFHIKELYMRRTSASSRIFFVFPEIVVMLLLYVGEGNGCVPPCKGMCIHKWMCVSLCVPFHFSVSVSVLLLITIISQQQ